MTNKINYLMIDEKESCLYSIGDAARALNNGIFFLYKNAFNKNMELDHITITGIKIMEEINKLFFNVIDEFFDDETKEYLMEYIEIERNVIKLKVDEIGQ